MPRLNVTRAADRRTMAEAIRALCNELGVRCEVESFDESGYRCTTVRTEHASGLRVNVSFDGTDQLDRAGRYCLPWNLYGERRLAESFGSINPYHRQKATHVVDGFDAVLGELRRGYEAAHDGSAFESMPAAASEPVARNS